MLYCCISTNFVYYYFIICHGSYVHCFPLLQLITTTQHQHCRYHKAELCQSSNIRSTVKAANRKLISFMSFVVKFWTQNIFYKVWNLFLDVFVYSPLVRICSILRTNGSFSFSLSTLYSQQNYAVCLSVFINSLFR